MGAVAEQCRRMVFNLVTRNQDDHVKNIAFLMDKTGRWSLAPAFAVTYRYNPAGIWPATHQMPLTGRRDGFTREDFAAGAKSALLKRGRTGAILEEVRAAVARWPEFAAQALVADAWREQIQRTPRMTFPRQ
jgi:serine/threonine-protein kinase HipA